MMDFCTQTESAHTKVVNAHNPGYLHTDLGINFVQIHPLKQKKSPSLKKNHSKIAHLHTKLGYIKNLKTQQKQQRNVSIVSFTTNL